MAQTDDDPGVGPVDLGALIAQSIDRSFKRALLGRDDDRHDPLSLPGASSARAFTELDLKALEARLEGLGPLIRAIYCVDRLSWRPQLQTLLADLAGPPYTHIFGASGYFGAYGTQGIQLHVIFRGLPLPKDAPWYCHVPGVWIVFSDGSVQLLEGTLENG